MVLSCRLTLLGGLDDFRWESGVRNRYGRALGAGQSFDLSIELMRQRLDDTGAKSGLALGKAAGRLASPVVSDRKLPIRSDHVIGDGDPAFGLIVGEGVLERIHDEFSHDQAKTLSLAGRGASSLTNHFQRDRPGVADHRMRKTLAQFR